MEGTRARPTVLVQGLRGSLRTKADDNCNESLKATRCDTLLRHLYEAFGNKAGPFETHPTARIHLLQLQQP